MVITSETSKSMKPFTSDQLAKEFSALLRSYLTREQITEAIRRNLTPEYDGGACASHDFCDANEVMHESFLKLSDLSEMDLQDDSQIALWNKAWRIAKRSDFFHSLN